MDNMLEQLFSGLIPVAILSVFVIYAIYVFKTKVQPDNERNQNKTGSENEQKN
ncbi:UNVERIFIED_ORG: hypothetical protein DFO82_2667 [Idiomarina abyssalis]|nr:hypothetical protein DEU30_11423 [Idiomarina sp. 017G]